MDLTPRVNRRHCPLQVILPIWNHLRTKKRKGKEVLKPCQIESEGSIVTLCRITRIDLVSNGREPAKNRKGLPLLRKSDKISTWQHKPIRFQGNAFKSHSSTHSNFQIGESQIHHAKQPIKQKESRPPDSRQNTNNDMAQIGSRFATLQTTGEGSPKMQNILQDVRSKQHSLQNWNGTFFTYKYSHAFYPPTVYMTFNG